jgi:hypothetical protein
MTGTVSVTGIASMTGTETEMTIDGVLNKAPND